MKRISCVLLCMMFLCGCILPAKTNKDTVLQDTQLMTESVLPYVEKKKDTFFLKEENTSNTENSSNIGNSTK